MSTRTVEELLQIHGLSKVKPPPTLREHVKACPHCTVDADGEVWTCDEGAAIRQRERKARL